MRGIRLLAKVMAALGGVVVSVFVLAGLYVLEATLFLPSRGSGESQSTVGWDPISLWHQAASGNVHVLGMLLGVALLIILPPVIAVLAGKYVFHRILRISAQL